MAEAFLGKTKLAISSSRRSRFVLAGVQTANASIERFDAASRIAFPATVSGEPVETENEVQVVALTGDKTTFLVKNTTGRTTFKIGLSSSMRTSYGNAVPEATAPPANDTPCSAVVTPKPCRPRYGT